MSLIQNNDQEILVPVTDGNGTDFNLTAITSATYKLFTKNRTTEVITKTLNSGIVRSSNILTVTLTKDDTKNIRGTYYHELAIIDPVKGLSTVFKQEIYFEPTEI